MKAAIALNKAGKDEESLAAFRAACDVEPGSAQHATNLAVALMKAGRLEDSRDALEVAGDLLDAQQNTAHGLSRRKAEKLRARLDAWRANREELQRAWQSSGRGDAPYPPLEGPAVAGKSRYMHRNPNVPLYSLAERPEADHRHGAAKQEGLAKDPEDLDAAPAKTVAIEGVVKVAFQYTFAQPDIATVLVGVTSTEQLDVNLRWLNEPLDMAVAEEVQAALDPIRNKIWVETGSEENIALSAGGLWAAGRPGEEANKILGSSANLGRTKAKAS
eukprot:g3162.t1